MFSRKNIPLIIGIFIPILMIIFVGVSIYFPSIFWTNPKYNFIYLSGESYPSRYYIQGNRLLKQDTPTPYVPTREAKLFIYNIESNEAKAISFDEAKDLNLDSANVSPDGYSVEYGASSGGFSPFFFYSGNDYNSVYLKNNKASKKLNINLSGNYYGFTFLGWIIK